MSDTIFREIKLELSQENGLDLVVLLDESSPVPNLSGYYEVLYEENRPNNGRTVIMFYFPEDEIAASSNLEILLAARNISDYDLQEKSLNKDDYLQNYKEHYHPSVPGERIIIVPSWYKDTPTEKKFITDDSISLYLDPGLAFGTGQHPTTRLCIRKLESIDLNGLSFIDAGTGSGILSIAALLLGAAQALSFDVDGTAVRGTQQNLELNPSVKDQVQLREGGFDISEFSEFGADFLLANITENILILNGDLINAGKFSRMLLSGVLIEQQNMVIEYFEPNWNLDLLTEEDGWVLMDFSRRKS